MTNRGKAHTLVCALAILALIVASPAVAGDGGGATIEELIDNCKGKASLAELLPMVHPDDRPMMGFAMSMMGAMAPMMAMQDDASAEEQEAMAEKLMAEYEALEAKHGLKEIPEDAPTGETPEGMAMRARYAFDGVDIAAFVSDVEGWLAESVGDEALGGGLTPDFEQIENLQIDGDGATATVEGKPIRFSRDGELWYLRIDM